MLDPFGTPVQNDPNYQAPREQTAFPDETTGGYAEGGNTKRKDLMDGLYSLVNRSLLVYKLFYFFNYAAFGSIFPLISIYFKQLGMSPLQTGFISGSRQLIESLAIPFWCHIAEKWKRAKHIFLFSLFCCLLYTESLSFIKPRPEGCLVRLPHWENVTKLEYAVHTPYMTQNNTDLQSIPMDVSQVKKIGQSPLVLKKDFIAPPDEVKRTMKYEYDSEQFDRQKPFIDVESYSDNMLVMPLYSTVVYNKNNLYLTFALFLFITIIGEFLISPALPLAEISVVHCLGDQIHLPRQKIFGSIGWALAMFLTGLALDYSNTFPDHPCLASGKREHNYTICFAMYSVFMIIAIFFAFRFSFHTEGEMESLHYKLVKDKLARIFLKRQTKSRGKLVNEEDPNETSPSLEEGSDEANANEMRLNQIYEEKERELDLAFDINDPSAIAHLRFTKWPKCAKEFMGTRSIIFMIVVIYLGIGMGLVFTFLFWHLQEIKGSPTLFGIASVINHISEICAIYFLKSLTDKIGSVNTICLGLFMNIIRFLYVSWINDPWWILPMEFFQGLTHSGMMTAFHGYVSVNFPKEKHREVLGFVRGIHLGIGRSLGSILGGLTATYFGSSVMFRSYGLLSGAVLAFFFLSEMLLNRKKEPAPDPDQETTTNLDSTVTQNTF